MHARIADNCGWVRCFSHSRLVIALIALIACGGDKKKQAAVFDAAPSPVVVDAGSSLIRPTAKLPPAADLPQRTFGRGGEIAYPKSLPLIYGPKVTQLDPPMRIQRVFPVAGRPLAVASGISTAGPTVMMIDIDGGAIRWIDTDVCKAPVVHTTADRIICAGWKGVTAIDVDDGEKLWQLPHRFRAANQRWLFAREDENAKRGFIIDIQTGKQVVEVESGKLAKLDNVHGICADKKGFDLYTWSDGGGLHRFRVERRKGLPVAAARVWSRSLGRKPTKVDLCDSTLLIETPIPGKAERTLRSLARSRGRDVVPAIRVLGWWPARRGKGIETSTTEGVQRRTRGLKLVERTGTGRVTGRLVASWDDLRLVRSVSGTLMLLHSDGVRSWMAAPMRIERGVITSRRLLGGSWLSPPQSNAETVSLWELPTSKKGIVSPSLPPPKRASIGHLVAQRVPKAVRRPPNVYEHPRAGKQGVGHVALHRDRIFIASIESRPTPDRGAGVAAFDLAKRTWLWHRENACTANGFVVGIAASDQAVVCAAYQHYPGHALVIARDPATGKKTWRVKLPTVDTVAAAGSAVVVSYGTRAAVLDAKTGALIYELESDNGHVPRIVPVANGQQTLVVSVETGGIVVARDPDAGGKVVWSSRAKGYLRKLTRVVGGVAATMAQGELFILAATDGSATAAGSWAPGWEIPGDGDLILDRPLGSSGEQVLRAHSLDGSERFSAAYNLVGRPRIAALREATPGAPILMVSHHGVSRVLRISASTGVLQATYLVPPRAIRGGAFSAYVRGKAVVGLVLQKPLAIQLF